jgi:hypothetical protein
MNANLFAGTTSKKQVENWDETLFQDKMRFGVEPRA